jgi:glutamyl-tRNA synthetase
LIAGPIEPVLTDPVVIAAARESLPPEPFGPETWKAWTTEIRTRTGAKGKGLFMPLRLALTGLEHGPDLSGLLPLIGRERVARRLAGEAA